MHVRERMIRERFATHPCEGCGNTYGLGTVLVLARRPAAWLILASCGQCEHRCIYLVSFPEVGHAISRVVSQATDSSPRTPGDDTQQHEPHQRANGGSPITAAEVADMRAFLEEFDGDFRRLFGTDA